MLEAKIHKEITDYESQIFFGLSGRKIVSVIIGIVLAFGTFFLLKDKLPDDILGDIILAVIVLPIAVGFFKYKGMKFEQFVKILGSYLIKTQRKKCVNIVTTDYYKENKNVKVKSKF